MIAKFFKKTKPINELILTIGLVCLYGITLLSVFKGPLDFDYFIKAISSIVLVFLTLFLIHFIVKKNGLSKDNSYIGLFLVFYFGMFPLTMLNVKILITNFILLLAIRRIYSIKTDKELKKKVFDSSLLIGIMTLIYPLSFIYIVLVYVGIYVFRKATIRNAIIPLVGLITPTLLYWVYLVLTDDFSDSPFFSKPNFSYTNYNSLKLLTPITLLISLLVWIIPSTTLKIITVNFEFKSIWFLLIIHTFMSLLLIIPSGNKDGSEFLFLFFPVTIIFTHYLELVKEKWFREAFLYLFLVVTISVYLL